MAVLAKVGMLHEQLPSVLVDPCLYYCCTAHQALAALCSEGCARTVQSTCVGVRNVNLYGLQLLYSARKFEQVFLTRTVRTYTVHVFNSLLNTIIKPLLSRINNGACIFCSIRLYYTYVRTYVHVHIRSISQYTVANIRTIQYILTGGFRMAAN